MVYFRMNVNGGGGGDGGNGQLRPNRPSAKSKFRCAKLLFDSATTSSQPVCPVE